MIDVSMSFQFYTVSNWNTENTALKKVSKFCLMPVTDYGTRAPPKICIPNRV